MTGDYMIEKMHASLSDLRFRGDNSALTSMDFYNGEAILEHRGGHLCGELAEFAFNRTGGSRTESSMSTARVEHDLVHIPTETPDSEQLEVVTWNIGGGSEQKCKEFLPGLVESHGDLRKAQFLLIQEAAQKDTIPVPTLLPGWTPALHKSEKMNGEVRGSLCEPTLDFEDYKAPQGAGCS